MALGIKGLSSSTINQTKLPEVKNTASPSKKIPTGLRARLKSSKKSIMKSFKKLELLKNGFGSDAKDANQSRTFGKEEFASMMVKRLRNRKSESFMSRNSKITLQNTFQPNDDFDEHSGRKQSDESQNQGGVLSNKSKFKIKKVRRKTNMGLTNQHNSMNLTKIIKKRKKSMSSSPEDFLSHDKTGSGEPAKKIEEENCVNPCMNKSSYGPIEYQNLKIPCQEQLNRSINIPQEKSRENLMTPSKLIIGRKANKNLKILLPTNVKLDSKCKTGQATIKENSSNQFCFSQAALQENSSNARQRKRVHSDKTSEVETADHPSSKCSDLVNNVLEGLAIASEVIDSQNENSDKHKQMKTIKSYLEQYSDIFKTTKNELLHLEAREADDLSQLSQFFDRIRKELNSREELLKIKYKSMVNSYQTSLQMDLEFLEQKCQNLCSVIDSYSKKFRTPTKIESNCSEDIMNSYNLESILLKEKVSMNKIESKKFTVQSLDTFQYPDLDCDFRPVRELIAEINVISENSPRLSDTSKMSLPTCTLLAPATEGKIKYLPKSLVKEGRTNRTVGLNNVKQIVEVDDPEVSETEDQGMDTSQRSKRKISESSTSSLDSKYTVKKISG